MPKKVYDREYSRVQVAKHRARDPVKAKEYNRIRKLKERFNLTILQYEEMLEIQNHSCAICKKLQSELPQRLCVDHDHATGKIRGLLCHDCNQGLGKFKDSQFNLVEAIEYLNKQKS